MANIVGYGFLENMNRIKLKTIIELFILFLLLISSFLLCVNQFYDHDEFEAVHTMWKLAKGQIIYVHFFQQKPPFFHISMIPILKIFSPTIKCLLMCKKFCYVLFLGIVYSTFLISKYVFKSKSKYLTVILLLSCTFFVDKLTEIRPDTMYIMLIMFSIALLYKNIKIRRNYLVLSAILAGISFAVLPKAVFYIIPIFGILCYRLFLKKISLFDMFLYVFSFLVSLVPFIIYYASKNITLEQYWFFNYLMNAGFVKSFSPLINLKLIFVENSLLLVFAFVGLFFLKGYRQKEIAFIGIILALSVFTITVPNKQYYVPCIPFLSMLGANALKKVKIFDKYEFVLLFFALLFPLSFFYSQIFIRKSNAQIAKIAYVLAITSPYDRVYDGSIYFNIFRDDVDYFWFSVRANGAAETYRKYKVREYDIYKDIEVLKPKIIHMKYLDPEKDIIKQNYAPTRYRNLYLRVNYGK